MIKSILIVLLIQTIDYQCPAYEDYIYSDFEFILHALLTKEGLGPNRIEVGINSLKPEDVNLVTDPKICFSLRYPGIDNVAEFNAEEHEDGYFYGFYEADDFYFIIPYKPGKMGLVPVVIMNKSFELLSIWPI